MGLRAYFQNIIEEKDQGISPWLPSLKYYITSFKKDRITAIGAYTGTGKTYLAINILDHIIKNHKEEKVLVVSTEMSVDDYESRLILMRTGLYLNDFEKKEKENIQKVKKELEKYEKYKNKYPQNIEIIFSNKYEEIKEKSKGKTLVIIDYIQDLVIKDRYTPSETMPILSQELKDLKKDRHIIAISQINNKHYEDKSLTSLPFAYGVEFSRTISHGLALSRIKYKDEKEGKRYSPYLSFNILKNRYGSEGRIILKIEPGHKMSELSQVEQAHFKSEAHNLIIN